MARTGSLLTSGTSLWCPVSPSRSPFGLLVLSPSTLSRLSLAVTPTSRLRLPTTQVTPLGCPLLTSGSSGFSPPLCYQASQALSPQYCTQICRPLSLSQSGSLPSRVGFMAPPGNTRSQNRRISPGKIAPPPHIPSNFTSVRFTRYQNSLTYACSSSSPQSRQRRDSLFATYMGSASCFLQTSISGRALALLALPFRPVTAGYYFFGACVMPGARELPRSKLRGIQFFKKLSSPLMGED